MKKTGGWNLESWRAAVTAATTNAAATASRASKIVANELIAGISGAKCLLDYSVDPQATFSSGYFWSVHLAHAKKQKAAHPLVSVWCLDKRTLTGGLDRKGNADLRRQVLQLYHRGVHSLMRLKHPGVVQVICPIEETRNQLVFVTEPLEVSLNGLLQGQNESSSVKHSCGYSLSEISELEAKHGFYSILTTLQFIHHDANIIHSAISPSSIFLTHKGEWKLGCFDFSRSVGDQSRFDYIHRSASALGIVLLPQLSYTAPELVQELRSAVRLPQVTPSADIFSAATVMYEYTFQKPVFPSACTLQEYENTLHGLKEKGRLDSKVAIGQILLRMLNEDPAARPTVDTILSSPYFSGDLGLQLLTRFRSSLQEDLSQREHILKQLSRMAVSFDIRILELHVLPFILQEMGVEALQASALPILIKLLNRCRGHGVVKEVLELLVCLVATCQRDVLMQLTAAAPEIYKASVSIGRIEIVPLLLGKALERGDFKIQEESLRQISDIATSSDQSFLADRLSPTVCKVCLATTNSGVRVLSFQALAAMAQHTDQTGVENMLETAMACLTVDKGASTIMGIIGLASATGKKWGPKFASEKVLPLISPLIFATSLNREQQAMVMKTVRDIVDHIDTEFQDQRQLLKKERVISKRSDLSSSSSPLRGASYANPPTDSLGKLEIPMRTPLPQKGSRAPANLSKGVSDLLLDSGHNGETFVYTGKLEVPWDEPLITSSNAISGQNQFDQDQAPSLI